MKLFAFLCLIVSAFAAPVPDSDSSEVAAHANEALRLMELFRMYQRQGLANPFLPAADAPAGPAAAAAINVPVQQAAAVPAGDASDEETEGGNPGVGVAPLNSDEEEEVEEVEATEPAVVEPAEGTEAPPAAATEPAVVDVAVEAAPVDDVVVDVPPVDVAAVDMAPEVAADAAGPVAADAAAVAAENEVTGVVADPAPL